MQKEESLPIIKGDFLPSEAKLILMNILNNKIKFHEMRNFSSIERYGKADDNAIKSIARLENISVEVEKIISNAEASNKKLSILAELNIQIIE